MSLSGKILPADLDRLYFPKRHNADWSFDNFIGRRPVRYFSYGRWALFEALQAAKIGKSDKVLLPSFICRDLLSAIITIGAIPVYYRVDKHLQLADTPDSLASAKAVLAVNYFGFPQNLEPFQQYSQDTGSVVIEDNAHGFLSRDEQGRPLGTRGDFGIFSLRKTIMLPNGAALVMNIPGKGYTMEPQRLVSSARVPLSFYIKRSIRKLPPIIGLRMTRLLTSVTRKIRKIRTGLEIAPSAPDAEKRLPEDASPCKELLPFLAGLDEAQEVARRRELYLLLEAIIQEAGCESVFSSLPNNVSPYAFPFYASTDRIGIVRERLKNIYFECISWPELPDAVAPEAPANYKSVWMIPFLC